MHKSFVTGARFGKLTIVSDTEKRCKSGRILLCVCDCGSHREVAAGKLGSGLAFACSSCAKKDGIKKNSENHRLDISGRRFGRLTAESFIGTRRGLKGGPRLTTYWLCVCDCGQKTEVRTANLTCGGVKSCGCLAREKARYYARQNFAEKIARTTLATGLSRFYSTHKAYLDRSKERKLPFDLSYEDTFELFTGTCTYCGAIPANSINRGGRSNGQFLYNGIDRVDSSAGYVRGNVVSCCKACNTAKGTMTVSQFKEWIVRVHKKMVEDHAKSCGQALQPSFV